jgi:transposase-like protein
MPACRASVEFREQGARLVYMPSQPVAAATGVEEHLLGRWVHLERDSTRSGHIGSCSMPMTVPSAAVRRENTELRLDPLPRCELP